VVTVQYVSGNGNRFYSYADALGSIRLLSDSSGNIKESYTYDPYGRPRVMRAGGPDGNWLTEDTDVYASSHPLLYGNPYLFTGRRWDSYTGLYYYRMRDYSPDAGRFMQPDPAGYIDGINLYAYCGNNPLNWIDPWGLWNDHSGFGSGQFDYNKLDQDWWTSPWNPITGSGRHFRSRPEIAQDLRRAIREQDAKAFEQHMHEWQDSYSHYDQGYRWPWTLGHIPHSILGASPDNPTKNLQAYNEADRTTQEWEDLWNQNPGINDLANEAGKWTGKCP
jgi:RHS repeat-associated protein